MNIHMISKQKFTDKFVELIESSYPSMSNIVYIYDLGEGFECKDAPCARVINRLDDIDLTYLNSEDKFFVHGFYDRQVIWFLYKNINRFKENQLVLICWGADIYDARFLLDDKKLHLRTRLVEILKKRVIKSCHLFMTFACADIEVIKEYYGGDGIQFDCLYPSNVDIGFLDSIKGMEDNSDKIRVLLGNSATNTNQHFQAIDILKKYSNNNIEIICPLSYGDTEYGQRVIEYGKRFFGNRFIPILDYMSPNAYTKLLNSCQIAIFNHNRQQGTGNIEILSYLGKKLYIRSETTTWKHYVVRDGCRFFNVDSINDLSFEQFVYFSVDEINANQDYFRRVWDTKYVKSLWDKVMEYKG